MSIRNPAVLLLLAGIACLAYFLSRPGEATPAARGRMVAPEDPSPSPFSGREAVEDPALASTETLQAPEAGGAGPGRAAILRNNEAARLLEAGDHAAAVELLRELVEAHPAHPSFRHNLAEALIRAALAQHEVRELDPAIAMLEEALRLVPERADAANVRALLERWRTEALVEEDHWSEASPLFELSYSTSRADILHHSQSVLDHLGATYDELVDWFGADPVRGGVRGKVRVVLHRREAFGELTGLGDWAGGAFDGTVRVAVEDLLSEGSSWRRTLRHELVHVFVEALAGRGVPGWLNEGVAQVLERTPGEAPAARPRAPGAWFPLAELQGSLASWSNPEDIARAYLQSELFVLRIRRDYGDEALRRMLLGHAEGRSAAASFEAYTQVPLGFVHARLAEE